MVIDPTLPRARLIPPLVLLAMVLTVFGPMVVTRQMPLVMDMAYLFYPGYAFLRDTVLSGSLPLWNHYTGCGEPYLCDIQRAVFYPPTLLFIMLPTSIAAVAFFALHVYWAGLGAYVLCRVWKVSLSGSLLAGIAYAFNSYTMTKVEFPPQLAGTAWFPWVLAAYVFWLRRRDRRSFLLVAIAVAMQFLAGHPVVFTYGIWAVGICALFACGYEWRARRRWTALIEPLIGLLGAVAMGLLLSAVQLMTTSEAFEMSYRTSVLDPRLGMSSIHPLMLLTLLVPSLYGTGGGGKVYWAPSCMSQSLGAFYVGIVPIVIMTTWIIQRSLGGPFKHRDDANAEPLLRLRTPFLVTLFVFFFLFAMGGYTPFYMMWRRLIPLLQHFRWPAESLLCVTLPLSCLGGVGLDSLWNDEIRVRATRSRLRSATMRYGPILVYLLISLFIGLCLADRGAMGKAVLMDTFNLQLMMRIRPNDIPWDVLSQDGIKLIIVGLLTACLVAACARRARYRPLAGGLLMLVAFVDVHLSNVYLLDTGPAEILDKPSPFLDKLPPNGATRILAFEHVMPERLFRSINELTSGHRTETLAFRKVAEHPHSVLWSLVRPLRELLYSSWPMVEKVFNACSWNNFASRDVRAVVGGVTTPELPLDARKRLLAFLNCDRILTIPNLNEALFLGTLKSAQLAHIDRPLPRAYVVGGVIGVDGKDVMNHLIFNPFRPTEAALVDLDAPENSTLLDLKPGPVPHVITRIKYLPNAVEIELESQQNGLLVVSDAFFPGWSATRNARPVPIHKVNAAFRGVRIAPGHNLVKMTYFPRLLLPGLAISALTLVVMLWLLRTRPRTPRP